jgi:tetratricopeptide (TPR) repeat protein
VGPGGDSFQRLAIAAQQEGDHARALGLFLRAIDVDPGDWIAHTCVGNTLKTLGRLDEAIAMQRRAAELCDDYRVRSNLALAYRDAGRLDEAIATLREAIARSPEVAELYGNLSGVLLKAERPEEAEAAARRALALEPRQARFACNLGSARKEQGDLAGAAEHLRRAVALDPRDADAHWNLGLTLLALGEAGSELEGWRELEWRQRIPGLGVAAPAAAMATDAGVLPPWQGEPLAGRTLLLQAEQGLGDTLQFARYARLAKTIAGAGRVFLECQPPLERLLGRCVGVDAVVPRGARVPAADLRAPLFGLPLRLGGRAPPGAPDTPYLTAEPARRARWATLLAARAGGARLKVGIAWQGNRQYRADARRSIALASFAPLLRAAAATGVQVFSLQRGDGREQLDALPADAPVHDLGGALDAEAGAGGAFLDSAAVMAELDLVITSDTAIPHLAGALGVPVWTALAWLPDWRWGLRGERCAWYPRMRLFRQASPGGWPGVFERLAAALVTFEPARERPRGAR